MLRGCCRTLSLIYDLDVYDPTPIQPSFGRHRVKREEKKRKEEEEDDDDDEPEESLRWKKKVAKGKLVPEHSSIIQFIELSGAFICFFDQNKNTEGNKM